jgi:hypothetical protein
MKVCWELSVGQAVCVGRWLGVRNIGDNNVFLIGDIQAEKVGGLL